ncbi:hypothetical protein [Lysinibacillus piscis]|uniref:Uncharacterized protein n=1 Tax=Lysinibacillus piscis TaxID=2518931 RepID=A0ABQ5NM66_9BACI|nr:hypothetical protein [Lysinibacillus sp. KH24]GLC89345.1 hypothetical protein LYSBPC_24720 [Lysinibacillus sp. KH24]
MIEKSEEVEKVKRIEKMILTILSVSIIAFIISVLAIIFQFILGDSPQVATIIGGITGMIGGIIGAIGAYVAAKTQIDYQSQQVQTENKKKARPFIVCNDLRASYQLEEVDLHRDSKIIEFDYYKSLRMIASVTNDKKIGFFQLKFVGAPDVILECEIKLYLEEKYYEQHFYEAYLDHLKNDVEIFIPIPYVTKPSLGNARPKKMELYYTTTEYEKFLYEYNFYETCEKLYQIENGQKTLVKKRTFLPTNWILPGKKKK